METLKELAPEVIVVAAFGQIITKEILEMPKYGCINVHASLLPAYRGAAPIQWADINGDKESGVTIMQMDEGLDTGNMIEKVVVPLEKDETGGSLFDKLSMAGAKLCVEVLQKLEDGTAVKKKKQPKESTTPYASMIDKKMGILLDKVCKGNRTVNPWSESMAQCLHKAAGKNAENLERPGKRGNFRETAGAALKVERTPFLYRLETVFWL